jgi:hypothetical protein
MSRFALLASCACILSACFLSIDGYQPDWDQDLQNTLVGSWELKPADDSETATVSVGHGGVLSIAYTDEKGKPGWFEAVVGRLGEHLVIDIWPTHPAPDEISDDYAGSLIPGHILFAIEIEDDTVVMRVIDPDVLAAALESETLDLPFAESGQGDLVLMAPSPQLHAAFATYLSRPGIFTDEPVVWRRVSTR